MEIGRGTLADSICLWRADLPDRRHSRELLIDRVAYHLRTIPTEVRIVATELGKPVLADAGANLHFSVSHSADQWVAAFANDPIGIDIERVRRVPRARSLAERYLHPDEIASLARAPETLLAEQFLSLWSKKEAVLKALGTGLANHTRRFSALAEVVEGFHCTPIELDGYFGWIATQHPVVNPQFRSFTRAQIRTARADELPRLTELALRSKGFWPHPREYVEACRPFFEIGPAELSSLYVRVAEVNGEVAGWSGWVPTRAYLDHLWIDPRWIRQGIGESLWRDGIAEMRRRGLSAIEMMADPFAVEFYQSLGCRIEGSMPSRIPGGPMHVKMRYFIA